MFCDTDKLSECQKTKSFAQSQSFHWVIHHSRLDTTVVSVCVCVRTSSCAAAAAADVHCTHRGGWVWDCVYVCEWVYLYEFMCLYNGEKENETEICVETLTQLYSPHHTSSVIVIVIVIASVFSDIKLATSCTRYF